MEGGATPCNDSHVVSRRWSIPACRNLFDDGVSDFLLHRRSSVIAAQMLQQSGRKRLYHSTSEGILNELP